jgi:hypothetical protein
MTASKTPRIHHPFRMLVAGASGTGKTTFVREFLRDYRKTTDISSNRLKVFFYHGQDQALFREPIAPDVSVTYMRGYSDIHETEKPDIVVIDDLMSEMGDDTRLSSLFTKGSHHLGISVIFLTQNLFHKGKEMRTVSLNAQIVVAMNNPRDRMQLLMLGRQMFPGKSKFFSEVLSVALSDPFSHLIIDLSPTCPEDARLRQRAEVKGVFGFNIFQSR